MQVLFALLFLKLAVSCCAALETDTPPYSSTGGVHPGSRFVSEALRKAEELIDTAYTHTGERMKLSALQGSVQPSDRLAQFKQPDPETRGRVRAAELLHSTVELIREMVYTQDSTANSSALTELLSREDLAVIAVGTGCESELRPLRCDMGCLSERYRTITGECNNRQHPRWGAANTPYRRWLPPQYQDGRSVPRGWDPQHRHTLPPNECLSVSLSVSQCVSVLLCQVRVVSQSVLHTPNEQISLDSASQLLVDWGQWLDHDLDLTPQTASSASFLTGEDCAHSCSQSSPCFPIQIPLSDPRSSAGQNCMPFFRSAPSCVTDTGADPEPGATVSPWPREQLNAITSFLDASQVYGSSAPLAQRLRDPQSLLGLLATHPSLSDRGRALLPPLPRAAHTPDPCGPPPGNRTEREREESDNTSSCFMAGDSRANEQLGTVALHTLFLREHNRLATELHRINLHWSPNTLYQEARKIVGAIHQVVTWQQYLPVILGNATVRRLLPAYRGYSAAVDPRVANVFATAAFRFAHVTVSPMVLRLGPRYKPSPTLPPLPLHQALFASWRILREGGVSPVLRGLLLAQAKRPVEGQMLVEELTERLFQEQGGAALDLGALNLQRGRDHGLPGYSAWRRLCGLSVPVSEAGLGSVLGSASLAHRLWSLYGSVDSVDVWVGAVSEPPLPGSRVGPLLACLITRQFRDLRDGDRFWWEREGVFSEQQREQLGRASLSRIMCDNTDIASVPPDPFTYTHSPHHMLSCASPQLPHIDLSAWREEDSDARCGPAPRLASGFSLRCGLSVLYECRPGYQLHGPPSVTCDPPSGQWRPDPPTCQGTHNTGQ
ncbi:eosinophil peroxidase [Amia ocellicauda]|uniref:eosinophil peroxidase n=1 Tax=Amia ocellicauda TaxID=2972642 RepID=UPI003463BEAA